MKITPCIFALLGLIFTAGSTPSAAQDMNRRVITEPLPMTATRIKNIHRVVAAKTPSGFEVPRYVSLKFGKTNARIGPSLNHPIAWQYRQVGLPVIVVAETENWRRIRDVKGDESWIYKNGLSGERQLIALKETPLYKVEDVNSTVVAIVEPQALLRLEICKNDYCKVYSETGLRGWVKKDATWGADPLF